MENEIGYVYVLTNPSFKENWVKIGKSGRVPDVRSKELDNTAVPLPFEVYATLKTVKYHDAESVIHSIVEKLNRELRIRPNREFFNIKPKDAASILEDIAELIDDAEVEYWNEGIAVLSSERCEENGRRKRGGLFSFYKKGLKDGDVIRFVADDSITAIVSGERNVEFENSTWKLSPLAYALYERRNELTQSGAYQGAAYFNQVEGFAGSRRGKCLRGGLVV